MSLTDSIGKTVKGFHIGKHKEAWLIGGALVAFLFISYQLSVVPLWKIVILVVASYIVDFILSSFLWIGDIGAGMINFVLVLLLLPAPASLAIGGMMAYLSIRSNILPDIDLPFGQIILIAMWLVAHVMF